MDDEWVVLRCATSFWIDHHCTDSVKKIKMGTAKVIGYQTPRGEAETSDTNRDSTSR
jgi:hypothetical protein